MNLLTAIIILLIPTQLGYHFNSLSPSIIGFKIDYLTPTLYLTDLLVFAVLIKLFLKERLFVKYRLSIALFCLFLVINIANSELLMPSIYKSVKLAEFFILVVYISRQKLNYKNFGKPLLISGLIVSLIAVIQFIGQRSIGGIFYYLGERSINVYKPGIAAVYFYDHLLLRPYSIFSHPNSLAGYLLVVSILIISFKKYISKKVFFLYILFATVTFILSASRNAAVALAVVIILFLSKKVYKHLIYLIPFLVILFSFAPFIISNVNNLPLGEDIVLRNNLNIAALDMVKANPVFGVGMNNFIPTLLQTGYPVSYIWDLQPVHNIYLLLLAETGLTGFAVFMFLIVYLLKKALLTKNMYLVMALAAILLTGTLDHYWLTLQQNILLFAVVTGLVLSKNK